MSCRRGKSESAFFLDIESPTSRNIVRIDFMLIQIGLQYF